MKNATNVSMKSLGRLLPVFPKISKGKVNSVLYFYGFSIIALV